MMLVGIGGALGAVARWKLGGAILHHSENWKFPLSTFGVNVVGCLVAGVLAGLMVKRDLFAPDTRLFLFTGLLGGFTTFSAFGLETVFLLRQRNYHVALSYVLFSVMAGVAGLWFMLRIIPGGKSN